MKRTILLATLSLITHFLSAQDFEILRKNGHHQELRSLSISPDNKHFVSVDANGLAIIWEMSTGQQYRAIKDVAAAAFSNSGEGIYLAMADKTFKLVNVSGQTIKQLSTTAYKKDLRLENHFYPESNYFNVGGNIFDITKGYTKTLPGDEARWSIYQDFSPALGQIAMAPKSGIVGFYDIASMELVKSLNVNLKDVIGVRFSKSGKLLVVYNLDTLKIFDIVAQKLKKTILSRQASWEQPKVAVFSEDENRLAILSKDKVSLYNVITGAKLWGKKHGIEKDFGYEDGQIQFTRDGQQILVGKSGGFALYRIINGALVNKYESEGEGGIQNLKYVNKGQQLIMQFDTKSGEMEYEKDLLLWDMTSGAMKTLLKKAKIDQGFLAESNGRAYYLDSSYYDDKLRSWKTSMRKVDESGKDIERFPLKFPLYSSLSFDDRYGISVVTNYEKCKKEGQQELMIYDTKTRQIVLNNSCGYRVAKFANTKNSVAIREGKQFTLYQIPSGNVEFQLTDTSMGLNYYNSHFSPDDRYFIMGSMWGGVSIINLENNKILSTRKEDYTTLLGENFYPFIIGMTPDSKYAMLLQSKIYFLDLATGKINESLTIENTDGEYTKNPVFSKNGRFLFVSTRLGTIKVWDMTTKKLAAHLYPKASTGDWAVITPSGRFDANEGAQKSMYYVAGDQIVPLSAMFEKFYTPRLLPRILDGEVFDPVPDVNKLKSTPIVTIDFKEGTRNLVVDHDDISKTIETKVNTATITIKAQCLTDAVSEIRLFQNGKLVQTTRNLVVEEDKSEKSLVRTFAVDLVEGNNVFRALALNSERIEGKPVTILAQFKPDKPSPGTNKDVSDPIELHLVIVGINTYKNPKYNLNYALADAEAFKVAMEIGSKTIFSKVSTTFIKDEEADKAGFEAAFEKVKAAAKPQDLFVFYYAGHGVMNDRKEFYLVPYDVTQLYGNDGALAQKGISAGVLQQFSKDIKAQKQLYILDACQSAAALNEIIASRGAAEEKAIAQLARSTGTHWLTASGSEQFASEFGQLGHGSFTWCLLEAFKGFADNGDKKLTVKELDAYLQNKVPEITQKYKGTSQYPASYGYGNDFPVIIIK